MIMVSISIAVMNVRDYRSVTAASFLSLRELEEYDHLRVGSLISIADVPTLEIVFPPVPSIFRGFAQLKRGSYSP